MITKKDLRIKELELLLQQERAESQRVLNFERKAAELKVAEAQIKTGDKWREYERDTQARIEGLKAENTQLQARLNSTPDKLYADMIKALLVKMPTMDLKDLHFTYKEK